MDSKKTLVFGLIFVLVAGGGYLAYRDYSKRQAEAVIASQREAVYSRERRRLVDRIGGVQLGISSAKQFSRAANLKAKKRELAEFERQLADLTRSYLEK